MIRALYTAASGMSAQQRNLDTIANNLANWSTVGFRQRTLQFQDMIYQSLVTPGAAQSQQTVSAGLQIGLGTKYAATEIVVTQGDLNQTNNPLDLAIQGAGFFNFSGPTVLSPTRGRGISSSITRARSWIPKETCSFPTSPCPRMQLRSRSPSTG